jgi:tRNA dimethylallyltransferase
MIPIASLPENLASIFPLLQNTGMFFLLGPTAVGKSEIAVEVALRSGAQIVGADAFQLYAGLERLTAAPGADLRAKAPHHLIGVIPLAEKFDVARYRELAMARVAEIEARGKRALVVGGTGLYVRALTQGLSELPEANAELRGELEEMTLPQLQEKYAVLDPRGMERIDWKNRRRLVRAIEVSLLAGAPFSSLRADWRGEPMPGAATGVLLERDREELYGRIDERVRRMFAEGVIEEVRAAGEAGPTAAQAIGYSEIRQVLRGKMSVQDCVAAIQQRTRRYAKRQLTWLRSENTFFKINLTNQPQSEAVEVIARRIVAGPVNGQAGGRLGFGLSFGLGFGTNSGSSS